jgi:hypothetical protein
MESDGCAPLRIFPHAAITSDVFIKFLSPPVRKGRIRCWKSGSEVTLEPGSKPSGPASENARMLYGLELKTAVRDRRRRVCSSFLDNGSATVADRQGSGTGVVLPRRLKDRDQESPVRREIRGLPVRCGNSELSVIRTGRWRIGQAIDRCQHDQHSEQPCQTPARASPC